MGLKVQEMQYGFSSSLSEIYGSDTKKINRLSLQALVRKLRSHPTPDQKTDITLRRSQLQVKVDRFQKQAGSIHHTVSNDADDSWADAIQEEYTLARNLMALVKKMMGLIQPPRNAIKRNFREAALLMVI